MSNDDDHSIKISLEERDPARYRAVAVVQPEGMTFKSGYWPSARGAWKDLVGEVFSFALSQTNQLASANAILRVDNARIINLQKQRDDALTALAEANASLVELRPLEHRDNDEVLASEVRQKHDLLDEAERLGEQIEELRVKLQDERKEHVKTMASLGAVTAHRDKLLTQQKRIREVMES